MAQKDITIVPIGTIHTIYNGNDEIPRQGIFYNDIESYIELDEKYVDGLLDLDTFTHAIIVFYFHKSENWKLIQNPRRGNHEPHGVFATRSPLRPSKIGVTTIKLKSIVGNKILFYGADMINGTPLLDIKPYITDIDCCPNAGRGWLENTDPKS